MGTKTKNDFVIGVLGGMGTYATINLFRQFADVFPAQKEWERPRIIIDNRSTMPSRVRAFLYNEKVDELVREMADSLNGLAGLGCNRIILACNTSHIFLPRIYDKYPGLKEKVVSIIDCCVDEIEKDAEKSVYLLGSEGTIESGIYQESLSKRDIKCVVPDESEYRLLRECIEAVKLNNYTSSVKDIFLGLVNKYGSCILGCTELPVLFEKYYDGVLCKKVYDPVKISLGRLKKEFDEAK